MIARIVGWFSLVFGVLLTVAIAPTLLSIRYANEEDDVVVALIGSALFLIPGVTLLYGGAVFAQSDRIAKKPILLVAFGIVAVLSAMAVIAMLLLLHGPPQMGTG